MAVAYVQSANNLPNSTGTTVAKAYGSNVTAAALLVASVTWGTGTSAASFSDGINGSWTATVYTVNDGTNSQSISTSYFANAGAGATTVTATQPSSNHRGLIVSEYSGVATASPIDGTPAGATQSASTTHTSGNVTVSQAGDLVYGFVIEDTAGTATISSSNVTIHGGTGGQGPAISGDSVDIAAGDKTGPASGTTNVVFTFSSSQGAVIQCLCFKAASVSSGGGPLIDGGELTHGALIRGGRLAA